MPRERGGKPGVKSKRINSFPAWNNWGGEKYSGPKGGEGTDQKNLSLQ